MNYNDPIDITAVNTAVKKHGKTLDAIPRLGANEVLQHMSAYQDITDSYTFTKAVLQKVSSKYTGTFKGQTHLGEFIPRTLTVHPVVMEVLDEPERYRRTYVTEVRGKIEIAKHPFELWLVQEILNQASNDLLGVLFTAKYDAAANKTDIADSFDGIGTIVEAEKTAGNITAAKGNLVATATMTRANIGDELLKMWRSRNRIFRRMNSKMFISDDLGDMYDDWFADEHAGIHEVGKNADDTKQQFLYGSKGKCELVRVPDLPEGSQFVLLTIKENIAFGFDKMSDMRTIKAVPDDYMFKALGKYVFGTQIAYIGEELFCVNDKPVTPVTQSAGESNSGTNSETGGETGGETSGSGEG
jgi:hypothetical protein